MRRIATALGLLLLMSVPAFAQKEFEPTAAERRTIGDCIDKTAGDSELEQMSKCIGLVADSCPNAPNSNTFTIVACNMREQKIWEGICSSFGIVPWPATPSDRTIAAAPALKVLAWVITNLLSKVSFL